MRRSEPGSGRPLAHETPAEDTGRGAEVAPSPTSATSPQQRPQVTAEAPPAASPTSAPEAPSIREPLAEHPHHPRPVPVTVWRRVDAELEPAFDRVVPVDLTRIFRGYGPLPAVTGTEGEATPWGVAGQARTVLLAGGGRMQETVVDVQRPGLFEYRVVPVRGVLRLAVRQIDGRFVFSRSEASGTVIRWTYVFRPRRGARPLVQMLAPLWRRYARQVMERVVDEVAAPAS